MANKSATKQSSPRSRGNGRARNAANVSRRVHDLTVRAVREHDLSVHDLPGLARHVVEGAAEGLRGSLPASRRSVLRQVVEGITDAVSTTAKSAQTGTAQAQKRMKKSASRAVADIDAAEGQFFEGLKRVARGLSGAAKTEVEAIVDEARRAGVSVRGAARTTRKAADGRLLELGRETGETGARVVKKAAATVLLGAGGLLEGLAESVVKPAQRQQRKRAARPRTRDGSQRPATRRRKPRRVQSSR